MVAGVGEVRSVNFRNLPAALLWLTSQKAHTLRAQAKWRNGRRTRLKIERGNLCGFESHLGHCLEIQGFRDGFRPEGSTNDTRVKEIRQAGIVTTDTIRGSVPSVPDRQKFQVTNFRFRIRPPSFCRNALDGNRTRLRP